MTSIIYEFDNFCVDAGRRLLLNGGDEPIALTPKIFDTLLYLVSHSGQVIEKDELMSSIWPDTIVEENNLNKNISVLRHVLGENPGEHRYIVTVPGKGYKFVASVVESSANGIKFVDIAHADITLLRSGPSRATSRSKKSVFAAVGVIAAIAIAVLAFGYSYFKNQRQIDSIAVMPFVNESGDPELEYLSDGMTETLIGRLSQLPNLNVQARSSVFHYKGKETDVRTVGKELNVQAILNGHFVQRDDDLTLFLELVDAQSGSRLWGDQYNRKRRDLVSLQAEIARDVSNKLKIKLSGAAERKLAKNYTENVEAYDLFLQGRFHWRKLTQPEIEKGIAYFRQAIDADPSYALAYTGIAEAYRALAQAGEMNPSEVWPKAKAASQKAVDIDDDLAEGHSGLGSAFFHYDWNWAEAQNQFLRALDLDPNSSMAHFGYAEFLSRMGRREERRAEIKRAREIEPLSAFLNAFEAAALPDPDEALERVRIAIDLDPNFYFAHMIAGSVYRKKKMHPESIAEYRLAKQLSPDQTWSDAIGLVPTLIETGKPDEARAILNQMLRLSNSRFVPPYNIALVYNALGEKDQALAWLEKGLSTT